MKLIEMEKALSELCLSHKDIIYIDKNETAERIRKIPSIDIVRCQDCRYRYMDADLQVWTCTYGLMIKPDGFCNYGEVRDEEEQTEEDE